MENKELKKHRARLLFFALGMEVKDVAATLQSPRETVSRVMNFERAAPDTRERVAELAAAKAKDFILDFAEEPATG